MVLVPLTVLSLHQRAGDLNSEGNAVSVDAGRAAGNFKDIIDPGGSVGAGHLGQDVAGFPGSYIAVGIGKAATFHCSRENNVTIITDTLVGKGFYALNLHSVHKEIIESDRTGGARDTYLICLIDND